MRERIGAGALALLLAGGYGCTAVEEPQAVDLLVVNARITTLDAERPQAAWIAARDGRIVALGNDDDFDDGLQAAETIDAGGRRLVPGFIEGHGHFLGLGRSLVEIDLTGAARWPEVVELVAAAAASAPEGAWLRGRGWHQAKWSEAPDPAHEGLPYHDDLDRVAPDNPVVLVHASGHASMVNGLALELAGIGAQTADPQGGEIVRDPSGRAIGVLRENAADLVEKARGDIWNEAEAREWARLAARRSLEHGITTFEDAGSTLREIALLRRMADDGELGLRLWVMARDSNENLSAGLAAARVVGAADGFFTVRAIKRAIDGALGSHGAWLLEPYADLPQSRGLRTAAADSLERTAELAIEHDMQLCVHAIGDRANREVLDLYARTFSEHGGENRRWRIEHAQHLDPADVPRFASLGVIASMQAVHCTSDGPWVPDRLGQARAERTSYLWRDLLDSGAVVTNGTDAPVEPVDPMGSFFAAVTRRLADGSQLTPEQAMSREEALRSYTVNNAYAAFEEGAKGTLQVGKLADFVVLSRDIMEVPATEIPGTEAVLTVVGGAVRHRDGL